MVYRRRQDCKDIGIRKKGFLVIAPQLLYRSASRPINCYHIVEMSRECPSLVGDYSLNER